MRRRVPRMPKRSLEDWPPKFYCNACLDVRLGADDIRADCCEQCNDFLKTLELIYEQRK